jgi:hypothetical protein
MVVGFKKSLCGITFVLSLSLLTPQTLASASSTGDLSPKEQAELQHSAGIVCEENRNGDCFAGNIESGDYYNVRIYGDCTQAAYYGRLNEKAVTLRKEVATTGSRGKAEGMLAPEQLVCIKAAAQVNSTDTEYYVMALPMDHGPECQGEELCRNPSPLPKSYQKTMANCQTSAGKKYRGCPEGWVFASEMEAYSNGLPFAK